MPAASVIIPAFNAIDTLDETVRSVIAQTRPDWEAIIVDDGSTDGTQSAAERWRERDRRIKVVSRPNKGLAASRNDGAVLAASPWLLFLDADDLIEPEYLESMLEMAAWEPQAQVIHCGFAKFLSDGRRDSPYLPPTHVDFRTLSGHCVFQPNGLLIGQAVFADQGGFDVAFSASADWDMWLRIARTGARFAGIGEALALYRLRRGQMSSPAGILALFAESRRVIDLAYGFDPRVRHPHPLLVAGAPKQQKSIAVLKSAVWCAGVMIGGGLDAGPFVKALEVEEASEFEVRDLMQMLPGSLPHGACLLYEDWPRLWCKYWREVCAMFELFARFSKRKDFAQACLAAARSNFASLPGWIDYSVDRESFATTR
jgi:GT2 family glycosyltransferase